MFFEALVKRSQRSSKLTEVDNMTETSQIKDAPPSGTSSEEV